MGKVSLVLLCLLSPQDPVDVEGQPLAENARRLLEALDLLGAPLKAESIRAAIESRDGRKVQEALDPQVLLVARGDAVTRGKGPAALLEGAYTPVLVKIINDAGAAGPFSISSPNSGPVYAGVAKLSMERQNQRHLRENENVKGDPDRFLQIEMYDAPPMTRGLSGLKVEYAIALIYANVVGEKKASIGGCPVRFLIRPGRRVKLSVLDEDGKPTTGRFTFKDARGRVYPPQPKRLAPDLFFQQQVYRADGETVLLPPGELTMQYSRGPEYKLLERKITIAEHGDAALEVRLERWVNAREHGFYSGDHHIHAAGCAPYTTPTEGVLARDMFPQVKGEGLNVGCILTWGPCYDFQSRLFSPGPDPLSEPLTLLKYDIEVSGFGSQALGHVCLLNLTEQQYPGTTGSKGWPTWTTPVLRWAKAQKAVTGYAHSASGLQVDPAAAARRLLATLDADRDGRLSRAETEGKLLPEDPGDSPVDLARLTAMHDLAADRLPNFAIPEMNSVGAMEIFVTVAEGLCDFISSMDTARLPEWNAWYHILNCGFPLKVSGETDFPCMSGTRVGQGRVYVQLGKVDRVDYAAWCEGLRAGRSYVSDGYAHALEFTVNDRPAGEEVRLDAPGKITITAKVAFSSQTPAEVPYGGMIPDSGLRNSGDTVVLHAGKPGARPGRAVEVVVNGRRVDARTVLADDRTRELRFEVPVERSSWIALRHFPQMHTNPVNVIVGGKPIRASRKSALWCIGAIEQLWRVREKNIAAPERDEAKKTFERAIEKYRRIAEESPE